MGTKRLNDQRTYTQSIANTIIILFYCTSAVFTICSCSMFWLYGCWLSQPEARCHFNADSSSRQVASTKVRMWPTEGEEGGSKNTHQCYGVKFAPLLRGANRHLNSVCSSKIAMWLLLPSLGWIYHLCCCLNRWCQDRWFTFGSLKGFRRNVSTIKKKTDPLAESQTFSLAPHPCILHLLTVFMLYMRLQTVTQQKQNIHCSHDKLSQQSSTRGPLNLPSHLLLLFYWLIITNASSLFSSSCFLLLSN